MLYLKDLCTVQAICVKDRILDKCIGIDSKPHGKVSILGSGCKFISMA